jgi:voltage-gated sodium channel
MPIDAGFVAVVRLVRILRVLKIVTAFPKLRLIVSALLKSIPSIGYVFLLQILHFYIYGAMGTTLFAVNDPYHFRNLHIAMLTLFRAVTLEDWADIMYTNIYGCDKTPYDIPSMCTNPSPSPVIAVLYFVSFIVTGAMIVLNLFIGVIMNSIKEVSEEHEINELIEKRANNNMNLNDEVKMIERQLQAISQEMRVINTRIQKVLQQRGGNTFLENKMPDSDEKKTE